MPSEAIAAMTLSAPYEPKRIWLDLALAGEGLASKLTNSLSRLAVELRRAVGQSRVQLPAMLLETHRRLLLDSQ